MLKEEQEAYNQKVFTAGRNWTPQITLPQMPRITDAFKIGEIVEYDSQFESNSNQQAYAIASTLPQKQSKQYGVAHGLP